MANYNTQLQSNNLDLQEVLQTLQTKAADGEQATPEISVSSGGLITAVAGDKSATKQLDVQAAQTITPTTTDKTIASGRYLTGTQTIKGDSNLVAGNIKQGVSIFGVNGTLQEGSGGATLPTLINEGAAADLVSGKQLIDQEGNIVEGINPYELESTNAEVEGQADLIAEIKTILQGKTAGSADVETWTGTLLSKRDVLPPLMPGAAFGTIYYTDENLNMQTIGITNSFPLTLTIVKNSIIYY
jgi:hypothetical protein